MLLLAAPDPTKIRFPTFEEKEQLNRMRMSIEQADITRLFHFLISQGATPKINIIQKPDKPEALIAQLEIGNVYYTFDVGGNHGQIDSETQFVELYYSGWAVPDTLLHHENVSTQNAH